MSLYFAGAVWWKSHDFQDGQGFRKKYFVLLTDCETPGELFLAAMTTSKGDRRYDTDAMSASPCGCPTRNFFRIEANQESCFPATTWVQFDNKGPIGQSKLDELSRQAMAGFVQALSPERLRSLLNCAKRSKDIEKRDLERIDRALKARNPANKPPVRAAAVPPAPPADPKLEAARVRRGRYCISCRLELDGLLDVQGLELVLQGKKQMPDGFFVTMETGFDLVSGCGSCSK